MPSPSPTNGNELHLFVEEGAEPKQYVFNLENDRHFLTWLGELTKK